MNIWCTAKNHQLFDKYVRMSVIWRLEKHLSHKHWILCNTEHILVYRFMVQLRIMQNKLMWKPNIVERRKMMTSSIYWRREVSFANWFWVINSLGKFTIYLSTLERKKGISKYVKYAKWLVHTKYIFSSNRFKSIRFHYLIGFIGIHFIQYIPADNHWTSLWCLWAVKFICFFPVANANATKKYMLVNSMTN